MKIPKNFGSDHYNCKDFFSLVLLALIDTEYRFLWLDVESSGSSPKARIFNCSKLRKKIKDGTLGLPEPEPLGVRPTERLLQSSWCIGWAGGQDLRCEKQLPLRQKKLASISPFQDYSLFQELLFKLVLQQISNKYPTKNPIDFQQVSKLFPTKFF